MVAIYVFQVSLIRVPLCVLAQDCLKRMEYRAIFTVAEVSGNFYYTVTIDIGCHLYVCLVDTP